jgi:hypothetical protein
MSVSHLFGHYVRGELCLGPNPCSRARHVKCDERRPSCLNCTTTGRKCDGYNSDRATSHEQALSALGFARLCTKKTSPWNDSQVTLARTLGLPSNEQSNSFFHSFLHGCVPSLTEAMDSEFWQKSIQRASSSPAVQHAAIALGAVYEQRVARQNHHGSLASSTNDKRLELLSSLRYASAIQILRHRISESSQNQEMLEEIMIACLIFIFLEILRGEDVAAVTHLDGALKLYSCIQPTGQALIHSREDKVASDMNTALESLTKTFLRLDVQSVLYMGSRTPWCPDGTLVWFHTSEEIPAVFETFLDARDSLYAHLANIMSFVTPPQGAEKCFPEWSPHPDRGFDIYTIFHGSTYRDFNMPKAATQRRHFMHVLSRWKSAFQGFRQKGTAKSPEALAGCALLWLAYYTTRINLTVAYTKHECSYDEQLPSFNKIAEQAEAYLKYTAYASPSQLPKDPNERLADNIPSLKPKKNDFKVYSTVCYPLYFTALKCRYKPLRQAALAMLRNAESEGIWDADMLARIAEFVIDVEEYSIEPDSHSDTPRFGVPEINRIHCLSLNIDKTQRIIWLRYSRRAIEAQEEISQSSDPLKRWRIDDTILTWKDSTKERAETIDPKHSILDLPPSATLS